MKRIEISVKNLVAWQTNSTDYVCGNSKFVVCFDFDKEWNEFETKTARFYHDGEYTDIVFTGTECKVPVILNAKRMEVGVFAGDLHTTTPAVVDCRKSILCKSGTPADPTPDVYAQIMKKLNKSPIFFVYINNDKDGNLISNRSLGEIKEHMENNYFVVGRKDGKDLFVYAVDENSVAFIEYSTGGGPSKIYNIFADGTIECLFVSHDHANDFVSVSSSQKLSDAQMERARMNIGALAKSDLPEVIEAYMKENPPSGGNADFKTDETLTLKDGVLSVNTDAINTMSDVEIARLTSHMQ